MNYFRIPTNIFVLIVLSQVKNLPINLVYSICAALLLISFIFHFFYIDIKGIETNQTKNIELN
jgi:succinate dehydrogenase/fumarate reductase cytochrome b subunit